METKAQALNRIFSGKAPLMMVAQPKPLKSRVIPKWGKRQGKTFQYQGGRIRTWRGQDIWCAEYIGDISVFDLGETEEKAIGKLKGAINDAGAWIHQYPQSKRQYQVALKLTREI